jgi:hypothetical protein
LTCFKFTYYPEQIENEREREREREREIEIPDNEQLKAGRVYSGSQFERFLLHGREGMTHILKTDVFMSWKA